MASCITAQERGNRIKVEDISLKAEKHHYIKKDTVLKAETVLTSIENIDTVKAFKCIDIAPGLEDTTKEQLKQAVRETPEIAKGLKGIIKTAQSRDEYSSNLDWLMDIIWQIALIWGLLEAAVRKLTFIPKQLSPFYWFKKLLGKHNGFQITKDEAGNKITRTGTWEGNIFIPEGSEVVIQEKPKE